jgi:hypothetical protein
MSLPMTAVEGMGFEPMSGSHGFIQLLSNDVLQVNR